MRLIFHNIAVKYGMNLVPIKIYYPLHKVAQLEAKKHRIQLIWNPETKKWYTEKRYTHMFEVVIVDGEKKLHIELI
jgi:general stress protein 26